jgi:hypothetical protein
MGESPSSSKDLLCSVRYFMESWSPEVLQTLLKVTSRHFYFHLKLVVLRLNEFQMRPYLSFVICAGVILVCFSLSVGSAQTLSSSNLPIVIVNTDGSAWIPDEPKTSAWMGIVDNGPGNRNNITDEPNDYEGRIGIERRGSSSSGFPKAQYGLELWSDAGADSSASLLGMPEEEDWILFAPYNDKSLMRDALAYRMARDQGRYAPRTRYCELVLNGVYEGIYVLEEKIKRDANRVDISKLNPDEIGGDDVTGGYILKIDKFTGNGGDGFFSQYRPQYGRQGQQIFFQYDYPEPESIVAAQRSYIQQFIRNFESTLNSSNYRDPQQGYAAYIDVESFVDFMIINEVSKNVDGYRLSTFMHKDKNSEGGKLKMGPVWDFNLGFGNADYCTSGNPEGFVLDFNEICPDDGFLIPFWWNRLLSDRNFKKKLGDRWVELRQGPFSTSKVHAYIDSVAAVLNVEARQRNFQRWPVLGQYVWPNYFVGQTYAQEVTWLKNWVSQRMSWLDGQWEGYVTGSEDLGTERSSSIFPNPSDHIWWIQFYNAFPGQIKVDVIDIMGRPVMSKSDEADAGTVRISVPAKDVQPGLYVLRLHAGGKVYDMGKAIRR